MILSNRIRLRCEPLESRDVPDAHPVTAMTQNLYVGFDINTVIPAIVTGNPAVFIPAISQAWAAVRATNFPERAAALADQIAAAQPDLIGLQEASLWRTGPALNPAPATFVEYDFAQILVDQLSARGLHYAAVATSFGVDAEFPAVTHRGILQDLRLTDREVLLARTDQPPGHLRITNAQAGNFAANLVLPFPTGAFTVRRGWVSADVTSRGDTFRIISTHLDPDSVPIQVAQAAELLAGPGNTTLPVVFVGDYNSPADGTGTSTYTNLQAAGFTDAWAATHPGDPGFTFGQDAGLRNPVSHHARRIDLILTRGDVVALSSDIIGEDPADRTASGLWISDHAGVIAMIGLNVPHGIAQSGGQASGHTAAGPAAVADSAVDLGSLAAAGPTANRNRSGRWTLIP